LITVFDFITVGCFACLVAAFFLLTERDMGTLTHLFLSGVAFAVANQLGNAGSIVLALILIIAGGAYAVFVVQAAMRPLDRS
jgi:hypothetical protein